ncbi:MAG TPA: hypothetical protein VLE70_06310 [Anaerolineae bacterium]|nr:hypothetical protein [Anaerolineae bacterium]
MELFEKRDKVDGRVCLYEIDGFKFHGGADDNNSAFHV